MGALCAISFAVLFFSVIKLFKKKQKKEDFKVELGFCIAALIGMILFGALSPEVEPMESIDNMYQQETVETE